MIIDFHTHLGFAVTKADSNETSILSSLKDNNITKVVVFPTKTIEGYEVMNNQVIKFAEQNPEIIPFIRLTPESNCIPKKAVGVKIHPLADEWSINDFKDLMPRLKGLIVLFHSDKHLIREFKPLIKEFPDIKFVAAHGSRTKAHLEAYKECPNLYYDTSIKMSPYSMKVFTSIDEKRVLFGSDHPFSTQKIELMRVKLNPYINDRVKNLILGLNAQELLNKKQ